MTTKSKTLIRHALVAASLLLGGSAMADSCDSWTHNAYPVRFSACSYPDGKSGYTIVQNNGNREARICWTAVFNDGRTRDGCAPISAGESRTASCASCGHRNAGVTHILLKSYR